MKENRKMVAAGIEIKHGMAMSWRGVSVMAA
jgi:hypothetical protein